MHSPGDPGGNGVHLAGVPIPGAGDLFTATAFDGEEIPCDEGVLEWVPMDEIGTLELWTGDRIFLSLLCEREEFFSLKLQYALDDTLEYAALDGEEMDYEEYLETHRI